MGEVWVRARIGSLDGSVIKDVDALVDTGATDTAVPGNWPMSWGCPCSIGMLPRPPRARLSI
ncbi:hypothetical protein [Vulcanisaeta sp. JCM 16161]|uniref:hypothetical protein n=1 Tax=Vulcanisaeta sp. JCM 16161 TaxID=1295372 RepID=UPI001FB3206D|nr:hypothetical protein [Vulcanisaeta sp. JCM 16161]